MSEIDWPSWVQAVGSIVGIGIAIWIPYRQTKSARDDLAVDRNKRARALIVFMIPEIWRVRNKITDVRASLANVPKLLTFDVYKTHLLSCKLPETPAIIGNVTEAVLFDEETATAYLNLAAEITNYQQLIDLSVRPEREYGFGVDQPEKWRVLVKWTPC